MRFEAGSCASLRRRKARAGGLRATSAPRLSRQLEGPGRDPAGTADQVERVGKRGCALAKGEPTHFGVANRESQAFVEDVLVRSVLERVRHDEKRVRGW